MHHRVLHETKSKTSGGKRKIIRPVWANDLSDKKVKNTKLKKKKKKSPPTQENEALNKVCADLEVLPLATEKCTNVGAVTERRSDRNWSAPRSINQSSGEVKQADWLILSLRSF